MSTMFSVTSQFPCIDYCIIKGARCREICLPISQCSTGVLRELLEPGIEGEPSPIPANCQAPSYSAAKTATHSESHQMRLTLGFRIAQSYFIHEFTALYLTCLSTLWQILQIFTIFQTFLP